MLVYCAAPNGIAIDDGGPYNHNRPPVVLNFGENEVDDDFGAKWFAANGVDAPYPSPLVLDGTIYQVPDAPAETPASEGQD